MPQNQVDQFIIHFLSNPKNDVHVFKLLLDCKYPVKASDKESFMTLYKKVKYISESPYNDISGWFLAATFLYIIRNSKRPLFNNKYILWSATALSVLTIPQLMKNMSLAFAESKYQGQFRQIMGKYNYKQDPITLQIFRKIYQTISS